MIEGRFFEIEYDELYYICDKEKITLTYEKILDSYKGEEFAEEMAKDDYLEHALEQSLTGDEIIKELNKAVELESELKRVLIEMGKYYKECLDEQEGIILGNAPYERLTVITDLLINFGYGELIDEYGLNKEDDADAD